ncbi:hypothetical protein C8R46DRAFT_1220916 [Mycena filopes]|nr:hypothetical protein C8R46DRAFT_1220916 [Mycena filopes]
MSAASAAQSKSMSTGSFFGVWLTNRHAVVVVAEVLGPDAVDTPVVTLDASNNAVNAVPSGGLIAGVDVRAQHSKVNVLVKSLSTITSWNNGMSASQRSAFTALFYDR